MVQESKFLWNEPRSIPKNLHLLLFWLMMIILRGKEALLSQGETTLSTDNSDFLSWHKIVNGGRSSSISHVMEVKEARRSFNFGLWIDGRTDNNSLHRVLRYLRKMENNRRRWWFWGNLLNWCLRGVVSIQSIHSKLFTLKIWFSSFHFLVKTAKGVRKFMLMIYLSCHGFSGLYRIQKNRFLAWLSFLFSSFITNFKTWWIYLGMP